MPRQAKDHVPGESKDDRKRRLHRIAAARRRAVIRRKKNTTTIPTEDNHNEENTTATIPTADITTLVQTQLREYSQRTNQDSILIGETTGTHVGLSNQHGTPLSLNNDRLPSHILTETVRTNKEDNQADLCPGEILQEGRDAQSRTVSASNNVGTAHVFTTTDSSRTTLAQNFVHGVRTTETFITSELRLQQSRHSRRRALGQNSATPPELVLIPHAPHPVP